MSTKPPPAARPRKPDTRTSFYASIGAGELAVERMRALTDAARDSLRPEAVRALRDRLRVLQGRVQQRVNDEYAQLAARGEHVVAEFRTQPAAGQAQNAARTALAQAKEVRASAERAAKETFAQAKGVRTSARKTIGAVVDAANAPADKMD